MPTLEENLAAAGQVVAGFADRAIEYVKETTGLGEPRPAAGFGVSGIHPGMMIFAHGGEPIGAVDRLSGTTIQLARNGSADGRHHFIPVGWVERIDDGIHLTKS